MNEKKYGAYIGLPVIEAHCRFLNDHGFRAKVWAKGRAARIYLSGLKAGVTAFFDYDMAEDAASVLTEAYDGSTSISRESRLRVFGKTREQGQWWFEELRGRLIRAYEKANGEGG